MHEIRQLSQLNDDYEKLLALPYWQAYPLVLKTENVVREARKQGKMELTGMILPAIGKAYNTAIRVDRHIAMLRCVEAIRLYAHHHEGNLPRSFADITEVPLPADPVTGKDFEYQVTGDKAILNAFPPAGEVATPSNARRIELTLKKN